MRWRPRISLASLLLLTCIVALATTTWLLAARLRVADAEVAKLRNEAGYLTIGDRKQLHAIAVPTGEIYHYRWRLYLPGKKDFALGAYIGKIDNVGKITDWRSSTARSGFGGRDGLSPFEDREVIIDAKVSTAYDGTVALTITESGHFVAIHRFDESPSWVAGRGMTIEQIAGENHTVSAKPSQGIRLLLVGCPNAEFDDGLVIWCGERQVDWKNEAALMEASRVQE